MARNILSKTANVFSSPLRCQSRLFSVKNNFIFQTRRHIWCHIASNNPFIKVSKKVRRAIDDQKPVVALETTIYTHGG